MRSLPALLLAFAFSVSASAAPQTVECLGSGKANRLFINKTLKELAAEMKQKPGDVQGWGAIALAVGVVMIELRAAMLPNDIRVSLTLEEGQKLRLDTIGYVNIFNDEEVQAFEKMEPLKTPDSKDDGKFTAESIPKLSKTVRELPKSLNLKPKTINAEVELESLFLSSRSEDSREIARWDLHPATDRAKVIATAKLKNGDDLVISTVPGQSFLNTRPMTCKVK